MNTNTIPTVEMRNWMNELLTRADLYGDATTKVNDAGNYICTTWDMCKELVEQISKLSGVTDNKTYLVVSSIEFVPVLLAFGVNKCNITYIAPHDFKAKIASSLGVNVVSESLHTWKTNMKFDVVIGNPPYQLGRNRYFYQEFVTKSWELSTDVVAMITPSNWTSLTKIKSAFTQNVINNGLVHYKFLDNKAFDIQLLTAYFVTSKNTTSNDAVLETSHGQITVPRKSIKFFPAGDVDGAALISKISVRSATGHLKEIHGTMTRGRSVPSTEPDAVNCIYSAGYKDCGFDWATVEPSNEIVGFGQHKVIVTHQTSIGKLGELKYAGPEYGIGLSAHAFIIDNISEADILIKYLNSSIVQFIVKILKGSVCSNSKTLFAKIPTVDLTRSWTDAELYTHFNLTQEEIDYIEATVK